MDFDTSDEARKRRTEQVISQAAEYSDKGWGALHGMLCMAHPWDSDESKAADALLDGMMLAERLDELRNEMFAKAGITLKKSA